MSYDEHLISQAGGDGDDATDHLAAIEARAQAATEGPWEVTKEATIIAPIPNADDAYWLFEAHDAHKDGRGIPVDDCLADAAFIAHARTDVPALLALVRDQQDKLDRVLELADWAGHRGWHIAPATLRNTINEASA